jgi:replication factor A1
MMRRSKTSTSEYLAFLSAKYDVDPDRFFSALTLATQNKKSNCGDLSIELRGETRDKVMFLILTNLKVVAQLSVFKHFLLENDQPIRNFMKTGKILRLLAKKAGKSKTFYAIKDLRSGMKKICLKAKVLEILTPRPIYTRYGDYATVADALIADETGTIRLCLWNEQIRCVSAGDTIQIENAKTTTFRGQRQLNIGKNGLVSSLDESTIQMKAVVNT